MQLILAYSRYFRHLCYLEAIRKIDVQGLVYYTETGG